LCEKREEEEGKVAKRNKKLKSHIIVDILELQLYSWNYIFLLLLLLLFYLFFLYFLFFRLFYLTLPVLIGPRRPALLLLVLAIQSATLDLN